MNNNPYGPRKGKPPLEGLEAKFNALPAWGRFGLTGCVGVFFIVSCIVTIALIVLSMPSSQPAAAQVSAMVTATPVPTLTPISTPTPEPISAPASTPGQQQSVSPSDQSQQPASTPLFVTITNAYATDYGPGSVSVHTLPGAALTISVQYCTGSYATTSKLQGTRYADSTGNYTWLWEPETKCKGAATAYVNASLNGQSASTSTAFTVS